MVDSMKISHLSDNVDIQPLGTSQDPEITSLHYDSRTVEQGGLFFALPGEHVDGHAFVQEAVRRGAAAVVMERPLPLPEGVAGYLTPNARRAMALMSSSFYGDPTAEMTVVGVTGTNGKTTVTYLLENLLRAAGRRPAVCGTINYRFEQEVLASSHTTPESVDLLRTISEFRHRGADSLIMEVSSHALHQCRVDGIHFDVGVFTNLTPEHLDYHKDMESYFESKTRLFTLVKENRGRSAIHIDDPYGHRLSNLFPGALTCGRRADAMLRPATMEISMGGIVGDLLTPAGSVSLHSPLLGEFNLQNLLCAAAAGVALELPADLLERGLNSTPPVPGRLERIENDRGALVLVDYAHTGDALEKALETLVALSPGRMITIFGCGGDRDRTKRPIMGEVAARYSDLAIVTSDNPRTEDPQAIISEILPGVQKVHPRPWMREEGQAIPGRGFTVIDDRRDAIEFAVKCLKEGDILLVAGKGHEDYQIIGHERHHFDDREELRRALKLLESSP